MAADALEGASDAGRLAAFIRTAQYLASLTADRDVWDEIGRALLSFLPVSMVGVGERGGDGAIAVRHWATPAGAPACDERFLGDARQAIREVLESGFLVSLCVKRPEPVTAVYLPVTRELRVEAVLVLARGGDEPYPRGLLDVFLAVSGLVGSTVARLAAEDELRTHERQLERLVRERTAELERANERLQLEIDERRHAEAVARELAYHDSLTGLPNRRLFGDRLAVAMAASRRSGRMLALAVLDLDDFKTVNDRYGHAQGDAVLQEVSTRLSRALRGQDTVARLGGDEFVVLVSDVPSLQDVVVVAAKLVTVVREPLRIDGCDLRTTVSMGVALYPAHGTDEEDLLRRADAAMYRVKEEGRDGFVVWDGSPG